MSHLTDMEELIASIKPPLIREYMQEAMSCYMAGAYRGCVVLTYIALFDDLLEKLGALAKINSTAKTIYDEADKKKSDQDVFESYLIDQLSSTSLLTGLDSAFLTILRNIRNKSAHPSGHKPSAEEARFVFHEAVTRFLSKEILSTTQLIDQIIGRLGNTNFFPSSDIADVKTIVAEEVETLHDAAVPQLIEKLLAVSIESESTEARNAARFLVGLARVGDDTLRQELRKRVIAKKADDANFGDVILRMISADGELVLGLSAPQRRRVRKIISNRIESARATERETGYSHPISVLLSIVAALPEEEVLKEYRKELSQLVQQRPYSVYLLALVAGIDELFEEYVESITKKAGSSTFETANNFANSIDSLDGDLAAVLSEKQAFHLVVAIHEAAEHGAYDSKDLVRTQFNSIPELRALALSYTDSNPRAAKKHLDARLRLGHSLSEYAEKHLGRAT